MNIPIPLIIDTISKYFKIDEKMKLKSISKDFNENIKLINNHKELYFLYHCTDYCHKVLFLKKLLNEEIFNNKDFKIINELHSYKYYLEIQNGFNISISDEKILNSIKSFYVDFNFQSSYSLKSFKPKHFLLKVKRESNIELNNIKLLKYNDLSWLTKFTLILKSFNKNYYWMRLHFNFIKDDYVFIKNVIENDFKFILNSSNFKIKYYAKLSSNKLCNFSKVNFLIMNKK